MTGFMAQLTSPQQLAGNLACRRARASHGGRSPADMTASLAQLTSPLQQRPEAELGCMLAGRLALVMAYAKSLKEQAVP